MTKEDLNRVLQADLGKTYDPLEALKFLQLLESQTINHRVKSKKLGDLLEDPPEEDTVLNAVYKTPYVLGEIVLSGKKTRKRHPLCDFHPIHFRKTYLKDFSRWETNPLHEAQQSHKVWTHFQEIEEDQQEDHFPVEEKRGKSSLSSRECGNSTQRTPPSTPTRTKVPLPLGACPKTFRSQIIVGKSLGAISPVRNNGNPNTTLKQILEARKHPFTIKKLWQGLVSLNYTVDLLHQGGFLHNDLHKENLLLQDIDGELLGSLIDFETTQEDELFNTSQWEQERIKDKRDLLREACLVYLCGSKSEQETIKEDNTKRSKNLWVLTSKVLKSDPLMIYLEKMLK